MLSLQDLEGFSFTITLRQKPKGVSPRLSVCFVIQRFLRRTPLGFCLRVIVKEKPLNFEKTTSSSSSIRYCYYIYVLDILEFYISNSIILYHQEILEFYVSKRFQNSSSQRDSRIIYLKEILELYISKRFQNYISQILEFYIYMRFNSSMSQILEFYISKRFQYYRSSRDSRYSKFQNSIGFLKFQRFQNNIF